MCVQCIYVYIYIYIERERERERDLYNHTPLRQCARATKTSPPPWRGATSLAGRLTNSPHWLAGWLVGRLLEGTKGVPRSGCRKWRLVWMRFTFNSLHVETLMLTGVQTPFLGTPLAPLKRLAGWQPGRLAGWWTGRLVRWHAGGLAGWWACQPGCLPLVRPISVLRFWTSEGLTQKESYF